MMVIIASYNELKLILKKEERNREKEICNSISFYHGVTETQSFFCNLHDASFQHKRTQSLFYKRHKDIDHINNKKTLY